MKKIKNFIKKNIEDVFLIIGLFLIIKTTYKISPIVTNYLIGIGCIWLACTLSKIQRYK
ncbi:hypothetical protein [Clostridium senegalense]|uniref:hypothetical protein n=1 Tax=Clostridium senegalense TaxID=1465809 RepID=UPI0012DBE1A3|nr:hypothetical protein [Clostridium senegalense]